MWSLQTIEADATKVGEAIDEAVSTYKADAGDSVAHRAVDAAATFAKDLVGSGVFGARVQVSLSGHANPEPTAEGSAAPDQVHVQVRAVASEPAAVDDPSSVDDQGSSRPGRASRSARSTGEE